MTTIANPIYDAVFKYLMENQKVSSFLFRKVYPSPSWSE